MSDNKIQECSYRSFSTNGGIGHAEQKRLRFLNAGQVRFFPDEDHMTCYEDKTNNKPTGVLGFTFGTKISSRINGTLPAWT